MLLHTCEAKCRASEHARARQDLATAAYGLPFEYSYPGLAIRSCILCPYWSFFSEQIGAHDCFWSDPAVDCQLESLLTVDGHLRVEGFRVTAYALWVKNIEEGVALCLFCTSMIGLGI